MYLYVSSREKLLFNLNSFKAFADERIIADKSNFEASSDIEEEYKKFCEEYDLEVYSSQIWSRYLRKMYLGVRKKTQLDEWGVQKRGYVGIRLKQGGKEKSRRSLFE